MREWTPQLIDLYTRLLVAQGTRVCEPYPVYRAGFQWSERHLQCLWYDARYRPAVLGSPNGEQVTVLDPGEWNLEAGPDFLNATLLIQPGARQLHGDVEIHIRPSDWDNHGHKDDPAYERLVAHVTWLATPPARTLPPHVQSLSLAAAVLAIPGFSFDDIDLKAYPFAVLPSSPRPCAALLGQTPALAHKVLAAAGRFRIRFKAERLRIRLEQLEDRNQLFYEEVMAALGYKHNQIPFRALARLLPVASFASTSRENLLANLLGAARLLPQPDTAAEETAQRFIRSLWDLWWHGAGETLPETLPWRLHNLRPQNAPTRRLAAAAALFGGTPSLLDELDRLSDLTGSAWHTAVLACLERRCRWPFWNQHLALSSPLSSHPTALLGNTRAAAILSNVIIPLYAAEHRLPDGVLDSLPAEDLSAPIRLTANHLFGRDHNPSVFYAGNGLLQQGLLQIHLDFCLNAKPGCETCALWQTLQQS